MKTECLAIILSACSLTLSCSENKFHGTTARGIGVTQVSDKQIKFGEDDVFRIGDGASGIQSACANELKGYDLQGTKYYFQFEVLEDGTEVDVSISKICGVDKADMTFISVISEGSSEVAVPELAIPVDSDSNRDANWAPFQTFSLNKGIYSIKVRSQNTLGRVGPVAEGADEFDDFIIGGLNLSGNKKVSAIKVFAE